MFWYDLFVLKLALFSIFVFLCNYDPYYNVVNEVLLVRSLQLWYTHRNFASISFMHV
jgi:hypothetical protein